ncbi:hypothetical protein [Bradyrhizobium sp. C9]|uniref:hypothetical protein n=1 Tax=Bradyrhizobium sp. C9 TaxID=142585 RepID=UPI000BE9CE40|nr:hypothetical protein [Bradyrhizobium sp. C9]PDT74120.1 hypothetical protein CO675_26990 [Bradyrhizobium sp. C9]
MPTLNIEGRSVQVDDSFLKLSADQQNATVDEIAKSFGAKSDAEPADHGLSERQKLSPIEKAVSPITSYPETYQRMNKEARDQVSRGIGQLSTGFGNAREASFDGLWDAAKGAANVGLGTIGYVASPISAAYRSVIGQPVEDVTGIPREYTEFAAQLATPGIGLPGTVKTPTPNLPRPAPVVPTNEIVDAARRVSEVAPEPVNVPRAFASDNMATQRTAQGIRNLPVIGDAIPRATGEMTDQLGNAVKSIASSYGEGSGPNVASRIGRNLGSQAEAETQAASAAAAQSDAAVLADWERAHTGARDAIGAAETNAADATRRAVGDMSPQDMGATLIARLRQGEREAHATKERLYGVAANSDGAIDANAVRGIRADVTRSLDEQGLVVDPMLTPAASRMVTELDNISSLRIPNRVASPTSTVPAGSDVNVAAVNMQGLEQTRKRLNALSRAATNDADRRAARHVIGAFDDWIGNAFDNALFSGSDEALQSYRAARAANADWRQRFGFNARDDADRIVNRIVTGEVTPQEVSNYIVGASKVGAKGVSSRLLTRLADATGNDPEALQAIRGGVWNRLSQATEGTAAKPPAKIINDIHEFLNGSGQDVAHRLFTPEQQGVMRAYADTLRRGGQARETLEEAAKNTKPSPMETNIGPMQELASAVLGKNGKSDEALFNAIDSYAKAGGRSDVQTLADIVRNIPVKDRGDLAGSIIRNLGQSKQTGGFSLDLYASEWAKYTPQAKAILFGNSGPYRTALDDIAKISQRYKDIGKRFGNPSGTAQNANLLGTAAWVATSPYTAIPTLLGAGVAAKMLSAPAGASSLAKWGKAYEALQFSPDAQRLVAFQIASRNLTNTASGFGANVNPADFMRLIQSPQKAAADEQQPQVPRRVSQ